MFFCLQRGRFYFFVEKRFFFDAYCLLLVITVLLLLFNAVIFVAWGAAADTYLLYHTVPPFDFFCIVQIDIILWGWLLQQKIFFFSFSFFRWRASYLCCFYSTFFTDLRLFWRGVTSVEIGSNTAAIIRHHYDSHS